MLPQNGHQLRSQQQQAGISSFIPQSNAFDNNSYFNLDPSQAAKQMAALSAANQARIANSRAPSAPVPLGGTSSGSYLGGINSSNTAVPHDILSGPMSGSTNFQMSNNHVMSSPANTGVMPLLDPSMSQSTSATRNQMQPTASLRQRQHGFLNGLANVMAKRNTPLPPALTGIPTPNYDPNTTVWKMIEPSPTEVGSFRLAGKDVDLFKLWGLVLQHGGGAALTASNGWASILPQFDLSEDFSQSHTGGSSIAAMLAHHYVIILQPFEEMYKRNMQEQHKRAQLASRQGAQGQPQMLSAQGQGRNLQGMPAQPNASLQPQRGPMANATNQVPLGPQISSNVPRTPQPAQHRPSPSITQAPQSQGVLQNLPGIQTPDAASTQTENISLDQDIQSMKRKFDPDDDENKRVRQKTSSEPPDIPRPPSTVAQPPSTNPAGSSQLPVAPVVSRPRPQPSRRKIEYVPLAREIETYGGRDLKLIEAEAITTPQRRPIRDINDWGTIDVDGLTMSLRSRLPTEISYALTTFTLLSTMRGQAQGTGFPIYQCVDLLDEVLDLLQEQAFGDAPELAAYIATDENFPMLTNRDLVNFVHEGETLPFAALERPHDATSPRTGPAQRPASVILTIINIIRNLSVILDNSEFLSRHKRLINLLLRLCTVTMRNGVPSSPSLVLSLGDVISIRKNALYTLVNFAGLINFAHNSNPPKDSLKLANRIFQLLASYLIDPVEAVSPLSCIQLSGIPLNGNLKPPQLADMALEVFTRISQADLNRQVIAKAVPHELLWRFFVSLIHRLPVVDADFQLVTRELWLSYLEKNIMAIYSLAFLAPPELKQKVKADRNLGFRAVMLRMVQKFLLTPNQESRMWFLVCARRAIEAMKVLDDESDLFDTPKAVHPMLSFGMGYGEGGDVGTEKGVGLLGGYRDVTWDMLMLREVCADEVMFGELESLARVD